MYQLFFPGLFAALQPCSNLTLLTQFSEHNGLFVYYTYNIHWGYQVQPTSLTLYNIMGQL